MNTEQFVEKAHEVHGSKYDYSKVEYKNNRTKVCIICPTHGEFWQTPYHHLSGHGCRTCQYEQFSKDRKMSTEEWIKNASEKHKGKYIYTDVDLDNKREDGKIPIICPEHGIFWQTPIAHMSGRGCPICGRKRANEKETLGTDNFIKRAISLHGDRYDYSKTEYKGWLEKLVITCPKHGDFIQTAGDHLHGAGCPECKKETLSDLYISNTEEFIKQAKQIHGDKYDYSKVEYKSSREKVIIICPKHGEFMQAPSHHLNGVGCPLCRESKLEKEMSMFLDNNNIKHVRGHSPKWLGKQHLDFYLPDYNMAIECQGEEHYQPVKFFGGDDKYNKTIERDKRKYNLCKENNVKLLYYSNKKYNEDIFINKNELLQEILKYDN